MCIHPVAVCTQCVALVCVVLVCKACCTQDTHMQLDTLWWVASGDIVNVALFVVGIILYIWQQLNSD